MFTTGRRLLQRIAVKKTALAVRLAMLALVLLIAAAPAACLVQSGEPTASPQSNLNLYGVDPLTLDPAISGDISSHEYVMQVYSGLAKLDDSLKPVPDIAKDWQLSDDGRTYTFHLRQDVKFQDGRAVTAADFKYSWERACSPATASSTAPTYLGDIIGANDVIDGKSQELSGVRVLDEYTLQVTIDAPHSYFLSKMTYPTAFVVDRKNVESGTKWWQKPNGTGPFKLKQWKEASLLVLERNDLYYGGVAGVGTVTYTLYGGVPMNLYETGKIDVTGVSLSYIDRVTDEAGPFYKQLAITSELSLSYIGFNTAKPPFDDVNIRRAFSLALDKDKLVSLVFRDMMKRADGILPPGMPGYNAQLAHPGFDPEKARQLIKDSKYGSVANLPPITLTTSGEGAAISQDLEAIIAEWRENLGVEVKVRQLQPERFLYHLDDELDQMFIMGWVADYPHPQNFLEVLFQSKAHYNYGKYSNPQVDTLLAQAGRESDADRSTALYQQAEQLMIDDAACIPLWTGEDFVLVKPYVSGYALSPLGFAMLDRISIKPR